MKVVKIKQSCGGQGCSITEYVMPNSIKIVKITSSKNNLVKKAA